MCRLYVCVTINKRFFESFMRLDLAKCRHSPADRNDSRKPGVETRAEFGQVLGEHFRVGVEDEGCVNEGQRPAVAEVSGDPPIRRAFPVVPDVEESRHQRQVGTCTRVQSARWMLDLLA